MLALAAGTAWAFLQPPMADSLVTPVTGSPDWWLHPVERNAFLRVHQTEGELQNVFALPNTEHVWVVGDGGLVAHSADGGDHWEQWNLVAHNVRRGGPAPSGEQRQDTQTQRSISADTTAIAPQSQSQFSIGAGTAGITGRPPLGSATQSAPVDSFFPSLRAVCFADAARGWVVGERGSAFVTRDSGRTWKEVASGIRGDLQHVACLASAGTALASSGDPAVLVDTLGVSSLSVGTARNAVLLDTVGSVVTITASSLDSPLRVARSGGLWSVPDGSAQKGSSLGRPNQQRASSLSVDAFLDQNAEYPAVHQGAFDSLRTMLAARTGPGPSARDLDFGTGSLAVAAVDSGLRISNDGGRSWTAAACGFRAPNDSSMRPVHVVRVLDDQSSVALDAGGGVWTTSDGWQSCQHSVRQVVSADSTIRARLAIGTEGAVYVVAGDLRTSRDGGRTWQIRVSPNRLHILAFHDSTLGWTATTDGHLLRTNDGGRTWEGALLDDSLAESPLHLASRTPSDVFALTDSVLYRSLDGGESWQRRSQSEGEPVMPIVFSDSLRGWGGTDDTSFVTTDAGRTWTIAEAPPIVNAVIELELRHLGTLGSRNPDSMRVWGVRRDGRLLRFLGTSVVPDSSTARKLVAAVPITSALAYGLDSLGSFIVSRDGGTLWTAGPVLPYKRWPAPWFYLFLPACVLATAVAARRTESAPEPERSVADMLISDRPLRRGDRDVLDFGTIAGGLSRFLRNPQTQPPLTIAISGPWGSGKSSLMQMLRRDLDDRRFRTVWFNAWHHQREEALLASLLESIRARVTPKIWTWMGIRFRTRLLATRFSRYAVPAMILAPFLLYAVAWLARDWRTRLSDLEALFIQLANLFGAEIAETAAAGGVARPKATFVAVVISIVGTLFTYFKGLKAFGVNPSVIAKSVAGATQVRTLEAQTTFRYRFAQDFREVTEALKPERLVIFIDDLDRCKPDQVLEILEAVNFLVDSGDCVVVLGIDRLRVIGCVAIGFKEVAAVLSSLELTRTGATPAPVPVRGSGSPQLRLERGVEEATRPPAPASDMKKQLEYARHYLEKLINMEIPIPGTTDEGIARVMTNAESVSEESAPPAPRRRNWRRYALPLQVTVAVAASVVALLTGFRGTRWLGEDASAPPMTAIVASAPATPSAGDSSGRLADSTTAPPLEAERLAQSPTRLIPASGPERAWRWQLPLIALALAVLLWLVAPREQRQVHDSSAFTRTLRAWAPVLRSEFGTPRAAKKFVNHVRFLAMAQRRPADARPPIQDFLDVIQSYVPWLGRVIPVFRTRPVVDEQLPKDALKDVALVSLDVVAERFPDWLQDPDFWKNDLHTYVRTRFAPDGGAASKVPEDLERALGELQRLLVEANVPGAADAMAAHLGRQVEWERLRAWTRVE